MVSIADGVCGCQCCCVRAFRGVYIRVCSVVTRDDAGASVVGRLIRDDMVAWRVCGTCVHIASRRRALRGGSNVERVTTRVRDAVYSNANILCDALHVSGECVVGSDALAECFDESIVVDRSHSHG